MEGLERAVGDGMETIDYSDSTEQCLVIPNNVFKAARANDIGKFSIGSDRFQLKTTHQCEVSRFFGFFVGVLCSNKETF